MPEFTSCRNSFIIPQILKVHSSLLSTPSASPKLVCCTKFIRNMNPVSEQPNIKDKSEVDLSRTLQLVCLFLELGGLGRGIRLKIIFMSFVAKIHFMFHPKEMINNLANKLV